MRVNKSTSRIIDPLGLKLTYDAHAQRRHCPGHNPFRDPSVDWLDCDNTPLEGSHKCDRCTAHDATYASYLHHAHVRGAGELPTVLQNQLARENFLYVAGFRDGSIKIGTSTASRIETRLAEQGAWRAAIVASATSGIIVREVEAAVTSELGIGQSVSVRRKLKGLVSPVDDDALLKQIDWAASKVHDLIDGEPTERISRRDDRWTSPVIDHNAWTQAVDYPAKLSSGTHSIDVLTMSGRIAAFRRPGLDDVFLADLGALIGVELEVTTAEPAPLTIQSSLF